jgi:hypothetical protein
MMHHARMGRLIDGYLDGDLIEEDVALLQKHLQACDVCRRRLRQEQETHRLLASAMPEAAPLSDSRADEILAAALTAAAPAARRFYRPALVKTASAMAAVLVVAGCWTWFVARGLQATQAVAPPMRLTAGPIAPDGPRGTPKAAKKVSKKDSKKGHGLKRQVRPVRWKVVKRSRVMLASAKERTETATGTPLMEQPAPEPYLYVSVTGAEQALSVKVTQENESVPGAASAAAYLPGPTADTWRLCAVDGLPSESKTRFAYVQAPFDGSDLVILTTAITGPVSPEGGLQP